MIEQREEVIVVPSSNGAKSSTKNAHFLKPTINPTSNQLPKPPSTTPFIANPTITKLMCKRVLYKGRLKPLNYWEQWVESLEQTHQELWKKVGIFNAIKGSCYNVPRHNDLIIELALKWCPKTNTFVFPWGEGTITLEDVMVLGGFSVLGRCVRYPIKCKENDQVEEELMGVWRGIKRDKCKIHVFQNSWMEYFVGKGGEIEHIGFLCLWLSRFVLTTRSFHMILPRVFPVAVNIARGIQFAFAPVILATIYKDLSLLRKRVVSACITGCDHGAKLVLWGPFQWVQVWAWERFPGLAPKPVSLVWGVPRVARWHNVPKLEGWSLRSGVEFAEGSFVWRPYALKLNNWEFPGFYRDKEMWVVLNSEVDENMVLFAKCLRACELVGVDCVEKYRPHRVALQFGLDQDVPLGIRRMNADVDLAWCSYDKPFDGLEIYVPPRLFEGDVTVRYTDWWRTTLPLQDEARISCKRKKRSVWKTRKLSKIAHGSKEGGKRIPLCRSTPHWNDLRCIKSISPQKFPSVVNYTGVASLTCMRVRLEGNTSHDDNDIFKEKETELNESNMNMINAGKAVCVHSQASRPAINDNGTLNGTESLGNSGRLAEEKPCTAGDKDADRTKMPEMFIGSQQDHAKTNNKTKASHYSGCSLRMSKEKSLLGETVSSPRHLVTNETELVTVMAPIMGLERDLGMCLRNATEVGKDNDVAGHNTRTDSGSTHLDICLNAEYRIQAPPEGSGRLIGVSPGMNTDCCTLAEGEQGQEATQDVVTNQINNSINNPMVAFVDEDHLVQNPFIVLCAEYESRLSQLEKEISALKEAKFGYIVKE